ncbi:NrsF family protein, partial [Paraburkholderia sp. BR14261]
MNTADLINLLAAGEARGDRNAVLRRCARARALGCAGSVVLMSVVFGVRHDLLSVMHTPLYWAKLAFPLCV